MGYTHYWERRSGKDFTVKKWNKYVRDCKKLHDNLPKEVVVQFEEDDCIPAQFDEKAVRFNGVGSEAHETFAINRVCPEQPAWREKNESHFDFCKTAYKPYDLLVTACLLVYRHTMTGVKVSSDGGKADWKHAKELVKAVLPEYVLLGKTISKITER